MVKPVVTWIVIADAARARILANSGVGHGVAEVAGMTFENEILRDSEVFSDRPGRVHESATTGRHAMARPVDVKDQSAAAFARRLADELEGGARQKAFSRLVLIAEPSFLGHLRAALAPTIAGMVHSEIAKDLTRQTDEAAAKALSGVLAL